MDKASTKPLPKAPIDRQYKLERALDMLFSRTESSLKSRRSEAALAIQDAAHNLEFHEDLETGAPKKGAIIAKISAIEASISELVTKLESVNDWPPPNGAGFWPLAATLGPPQSMTDAEVDIWEYFLAGRREGVILLQMLCLVLEKWRTELFANLPDDRYGPSNYLRREKDRASSLAYFIAELAAIWRVFGKKRPTGEHFLSFCSWSYETATGVRATKRIERAIDKLNSAGKPATQAEAASRKNSPPHR